MIGENFSLTPSKESRRSSILKKTLNNPESFTDLTPVRHSNSSNLNLTSSKNVRFKKEIQMNKIISTPEEKTHQILINPDPLKGNTIHDQEKSILELRREIDQMTHKNTELSKKLKSELLQNDEGASKVSENQIKELMEKNLKLQKLITEKNLEIEKIKLEKKEEDPQKNEELMKKIKVLENVNLKLNQEIKILQTETCEIDQNFVIESYLIRDELIKLKNLIEGYEKGIKVKRAEIQKLDQDIYIEKNADKLSLTDYLLICFELERLNLLSQSIRKENGDLGRKI